MTRPAAARPVQFEPEFIERLKDIFENKIVFNRVIGLEITSLTPEGAKGRIAMKPDLVGGYVQQRLHGGVISTGLDSMGGLAIMAAIGARHLDEPVLQRLHRFAKLGTIDLRVDYLRPAIGDMFTLQAEVIRLGSRVANTRMEFFGPEDKLVATGSAAYIVS